MVKAWRSLMEPTRAAARELAVEGFIEVLSKGIVVDPLQPFRGPIRLRLVVSVPVE
jgi:hypothetical protein|tara:strand:+ start:1102 stop:1269 length:168 start_codon:yes stop_codon:yes gene_type:complete